MNLRELRKGDFVEILKDCRAVLTYVTNIKDGSIEFECGAEYPLDSSPYEVIPAEIRESVLPRLGFSKMKDKPQNRYECEVLGYFSLLKYVPPQYDDEYCEEFGGMVTCPKPCMPDEEYHTWNLFCQNKQNPDKPREEYKEIRYLHQLQHLIHDSQDKYL